MLEANSFDHSNTFRVPSTINEISETDINEVTQGHWNNDGNYDNKQHGKTLGQTTQLQLHPPLMKFQMLK